MQGSGMSVVSPKMILLGSIPIAIIGLLLAVHLVVRPLDVLFFSLLRALGI
jgi:hypothetical protein